MYKLRALFGSEKLLFELSEENVGRNWNDDKMVCISCKNGVSCSISINKEHFSLIPHQDV